MIRNADVTGIFLFLCSVFLASCAQVLLKKSALTVYTSKIREYLNWRVLLGYFIMFLCMILSMAAYRTIPLSLGVILETTSYIYVTIFGVAVFKEKLNAVRLVALGFIITGVLLFV